MLQETYETAKETRKINILERDEEGQIVDFAEKFYSTEEQRALFTVYGDAGSGKSFLVKNALDKIKHNQKQIREDDPLCVYLDISDCVDQTEVYYRIALQLQNYYAGKRGNGTERGKADLVVTLYEWIQGIYRPALGKKGEKADTALDIATFITEKIENVTFGQSENEEIEAVVEKILSGLAGKLAGLRTVIQAINLVKDIGEDTERKKIYNVLKQNLDILNNRAGKQDFFLEKLKAALPKNIKYIIVLDNFQLNRDNEIGRDYTWLTGNNRLMERVNALWVVVSRISSRELFADLFEGHLNEEICLHGFNEKLAQRYLIENCFWKPIMCTVQDLKPDERALVERMLSVVSQKNEGQTYYLPHLLRMVVLFYWKLQETPGVNVTPDVFKDCAHVDEFVGYYFYKDLSDLMVNAFQILSCIDVWDDDWIKIVQQKMDNHLLNARNVLEHTAPIEKVGRDGFKLHEALREALYSNKQNYIKQDVMEYLFECFLTIYGEKKGKNPRWYELKRIYAFMQIVFAYVDMQRDTQKETLNRIKGAMANIYEANKESGTVGEFFIHLYSAYIDKLKSVYEIPFVRMVENDFSNQDVEPVEGELPKEDALYYMNCCFKLADLYTNNSQSNIARRLERLCIEFWNTQTIAANENKEASDWYYVCRQQKVKAINAAAYDCSAEHFYHEAYELAVQGLDEMRCLCRDLFAELYGEDAERFCKLYDPEASTLFVVDGDNTELPYELYAEVCSDYAEIWKFKDSQNEKEKVLWEVLMRDCQNLRGNFPWYMLHDKELRVEDQEEEMARLNACVQHGIRTYWLRRCILDSLMRTSLKTQNNVVTEFQKKMLKAYHNVCAYLSESGKPGKAGLLGREVLEETRSLMSQRAPQEGAINFLKSMEEKDGEETLLRILWKREKLDTKKTGVDFFSQPDNVVEQMQYMGDFYLRMEWYSFAFKWFSKVMLFRSVSKGTEDSKTLDTALRFYVAAYARQREERKLFEVTTQYMKEQYVEIGEKRWELLRTEDAHGKYEKYEQMKTLVELGQDNNNISTTLVEMLAVLAET